jgi:hypothetical protein
LKRVREARTTGRRSLVVTWNDRHAPTITGEASASRICLNTVFRRINGTNTARTCSRTSLSDNLATSAGSS